MASRGKGLTEARLSALAQSASPSGLQWPRSNRSVAAVCGWLFRQKWVDWQYIGGSQVLVANAAGRLALQEAGDE